VTNKSALWIPAQDKEDEVIAKDIPVKEGMAASVQNKSTEFEDQVKAPFPEPLLFWHQDHCWIFIVKRCEMYGKARS
jgi:hypothetical protein